MSLLAPAGEAAAAAAAAISGGAADGVPDDEADYFVLPILSAVVRPHEESCFIDIIRVFLPLN